MERRVLLAIFLSFLVLYVYQALVVKPKTGDALNNPTAANATAPGAAPDTAPGSVPGTSPVVPKAAPDQADAATPAADAGAPVVADRNEREIRVETADVIALFTNRGARLKSWKLKHYFDRDKQPQELIDLLPNQPLPFTLRTANDAVTAAMTNALYTV